MFACRQAGREHMSRLEVHFTTLRSRQLERPGRGRPEAFGKNYLPRPLGGEPPVHPYKQVPPQRLGGLLAQPPPPARPSRAPRALGRGLGTTGVFCPAQGAPTCAACAATGKAIEYRTSLGHEEHRQRPAAQHAWARALHAWLQAPQQVHRPWPPPTHGAELRWAEVTAALIRGRVAAGAVARAAAGSAGAEAAPVPVGSSCEDDATPHHRPPPKVGSSFSPSSRDANPHHPRGLGWGGAGGGTWVGECQLLPQAYSLSGSALMSRGGC